MSQENVEVVRGHFEDTNARRFDAAMRTYDPNVELVVSEDVAVDPGVYRGADAVGEWFGSWFRTFAPGYRLDVAELIPANEAVVAAVDHRGVGRRSGVEVTTRYYNVYWIRENKIVRLELFRERSEALKAVGLPEDIHVRTNLEIVRGVYEGWVDGDVTRALEHIDREIAWEAISDAPDAGTYRGHSGVRRYMEDWLEDFDINSMDFQEVIDADDRLVIVQRACTTGKASGVETQLHYAVAYWFRDDRIVEIKEFRTKAEALEAAGLAERP